MTVPSFRRDYNTTVNDAIRRTETVGRGRRLSLGLTRPRHRHALGRHVPAPPRHRCGHANKGYWRSGYVHNMVSMARTVAPDYGPFRPLLRYFAPDHGHFAPYWGLPPGFGGPLPGCGRRFLVREPSSTPRRC